MPCSPAEFASSVESCSAATSIEQVPGNHQLNIEAFHLLTLGSNGEYCSGTNSIKQSLKSNNDIINNPTITPVENFQTMP